MDERRRDAAKLLRALLRALEQKPVVSAAAGASGASAAAGAAAAAERSAGALRGNEASPEQQQSLAFWALVGEAETNGPPDQGFFDEYADAYGFDRRNAKTLYSIFYPSDEDGKCVVNRADLLYSVQGLLGALATSQRERDAANTALATSQRELEESQSLVTQLGASLCELAQVLDDYRAVLWGAPPDSTDLAGHIVAWKARGAPADEISSVLGGYFI